MRLLQSGRSEDTIYLCLEKVLYLRLTFWTGSPSKKVRQDSGVFIRGFADAQLVRDVRQLGWQCRIRARRFRGKLPPKSSLIKGNFWLRHPRHGWQRVSQFPLTLDSAQLIHNVEIHKHNSLTGVHLAIGWEETSGEKWYILSTEPTTLQTFREYALCLTSRSRSVRVAESRRSLSLPADSTSTTNSGAPTKCPDSSNSRANLCDRTTSDRNFDWL